MKGMATYDLMESIRNTNEWLGASARGPWRPIRSGAWCRTRCSR